MYKSCPLQIPLDTLNIIYKSQTISIPAKQLQKAYVEYE